MEIVGLKERIEQRDFTVGIIGLGYVGIPLVMEFAEAGFSVIGFDVDQTKVETLRNGESYIKHISSSRIRDLLGSHRFAATTDFSRVTEVDAILICVPTPLTTHREPDLSYIEATAAGIAPHLQPKVLVILESTTYPGTTDEILKSKLEQFGKKAGRDFFLAYSPEREDPGNPNFSVSRIPKVVGGFDEESLALADCLYRKIVPATVPVSSTSTAEAVKLLENIFRSVNIALVNELKVIYAKMGIDIWEVIDAAQTKPFGFMPFYPGPGLGGHCIPIDPFYLAWKAREYDVRTRFIELAGEINSAMPEYVVQQLADALNERAKSLNGSKILLIGLAYKKNVDDIRESPALTLMKLLSQKHADVDYFDPYAPAIPSTREFGEFEGRRSIDWDEHALSLYDAAVIVTDHDCIDFETVVRHAQLIIDTRNATAEIKDPDCKIIRA